MKKLIVATLCIALLATGCGNNFSDETSTGDSQTSVEDTQIPETTDLVNDLSFSDLGGLEFVCSNVIENRVTKFQIDDCGNIFGEYYQITGAENSETQIDTIKKTVFQGTLQLGAKIDENIYSVTVDSFSYDNNVNAEEIIDGVRYITSAPEGIGLGDELIIYKPGATGTNVSSDVLYYFDMNDTESLPISCIENVSLNDVYISSTVINHDTVLSDALSDTEEIATLVMERMYEASSQYEINERAYSLYMLWDDKLNELWAVLNQTLDYDTMAQLTAEEEYWIIYKENEISEAGLDIEGGTISEMLMYMRGAELTRERTYYLASYIY